MPAYELLNNDEHIDIKVITERCEELGDAMSACPTYPTEFKDIVTEYPIFFRKKSDSNGFETIALLGLEKNENLFLSHNNTWDASFIPSFMSRGPFMIGFQNKEINGETHKKPVIHIDMENPRVRKGGLEGESVFLEQGGNSPFLEKINFDLSRIFNGLEAEKMMLQAFLEFDLIEPLKMELILADQSKHNLMGYYTIHEERLNALDSDAIFRLHSSGFLQAAHLIVASLGNVKKLLTRKNHIVFG